MKFTKSDCSLFSKIGKEVIEEKDYSKEETSLLEHAVGEYIMSKSSKNGDIAKCANEFNSLLVKFSRS